MTDTAQAAADAARATRERAITETWNAYLVDIVEARKAMPNHPDDVTAGSIVKCRLAHTACNFHLAKLTRLIAQRDGVPVSDGPDVDVRRYG